MKEAKSVRYLGTKTLNHLASIFLSSLALTLMLVFGMTVITAVNSGHAYAVTADDTDSQVGLGFNGVPGPTPTSTAGPAIPGSTGEPTKETIPVNPSGNLAKTGWVNIHVWLFVFGIFGTALLLWAFIVARRQADRVPAATAVPVDSDAIFGLGESK